MPLIEIDWKKPDYAAIFHERMRRLVEIRGNPALLHGLKVYYRDHPADFISDWGITLDAKNVGADRPAYVPFILFERQREWVDFTVDNWKSQTYGLTEKTRQMGCSWLCMALSCTLCLFYEGMTIGVGSRKQEYVDVIGDPKSLIQKSREFLENLPVEFRGGWKPEDAPHMRVMFPESDSIIVGESGDNIGRGNSTSIYFVDEAAFLERPQLVDASLSQTTNCRQDISTPNGMGNPFAQKRFGGKIKIFSFHWRSDPRKDDAWYAKQLRDLDEVTIAQEIDINYAASVEGVLIPSAWVQASIDSHVKLGISPTGMKRGALDVADEGSDKNAFAGRHGIVVEYLESWSGKGGDIYQSVVKAFGICDAQGYEDFDYDADGLGAGVRGDARNINQARRDGGRPVIRDNPFRGSGAVHDPEGQMVPKRYNKDFFANAKAQAWWALRTRFQNTYRAVVEKMEIHPDEVISLSSGLKELLPLTMELSQPTYTINAVGKVIVDKAPEGTRSPNLGDAVMIVFNPGNRAMEIWKRLGE